MFQRSEFFCCLQHVLIERLARPSLKSGAVMAGHCCKGH